MSIFSGKADLASHISGMGGWYDKAGNPVSFNQEGVGVLYSDPLKDFEEFKRRTGGVIYQHVHIKEVSELNHEFIKAHCKEFDFIECTEEVADRRNKAGYRVNKYFKYKYWNKWYSARELNKKGGVYITKEIHFNTLLDLIPYFPYLVSMSCSDEDKMTVYISNESYVDEQENSFIQHGIESDSAEHYRKELADFYLEVCKDYFLKDLEERTQVEFINALIKDENDDYIFNANYDIDYMHDIEYVWADGKKHTHWTSPKLVEGNKIKIDKQDAEFYLKEDISGSVVSVKYVAKMEFPVDLK